MISEIMYWLSEMKSRYCILCAWGDKVSSLWLKLASFVNDSISKSMFGLSMSRK